MKKIPKYNIHKEPKGYFDSLPDRIIHKKRKKAKQVFIYRAASAAVFVIGLTLFFFRSQTSNDLSLYAHMDAEIELYINSGYWNAEDVLGFANDPNGILDRIIEEEWSMYAVSDEILEDEIWY